LLVFVRDHAEANLEVEESAQGQSGGDDELMMFIYNTWSNIFYMYNVNELIFPYTERGLTQSDAEHHAIAEHVFPAVRFLDPWLLSTCNTSTTGGFPVHLSTRC
jgi:hypothetical protein